MLYETREFRERCSKMRNVAYEMDFDIEGFLRSMDREARPAAQRRAGRACATGRYAGPDRTSGQREGSFGSEQRGGRSDA